MVGLDPKPERAGQAAALGADAARSTADEFAQACEVATGGRGVDAVLITADTPSSDPVTLAARVARDRGRVIVVGAVGLQLPRKPYFEKELEFRISRSYGPGRYDTGYEEHGQDYPIGYVRWTEKRNMEAVVALMAEGKLNPRSLVTHRVPIDEGVRAYEIIKGATGEPSLGVLLTYPSFGSERHGGQPAHRRDGRRPRAAPSGSGSSAAASSPRVCCCRSSRRTRATSLVGVCSATGKSSRLTAEQFGFAYCGTDAQAVIDDPGVNTVVIATRHHLHAAQTIAALTAGKHVFVEKPLCLNEEELARVGGTYRELAARGAAPLVMVGLQPAVRADGGRAARVHGRRLRTAGDPLPRQRRPHSARSLDPGSRAGRRPARRRDGALHRLGDLDGG